MSQLTNFFENFLKKEPLFSNKRALQGNYLPEEVPYRIEQINQVASILAPMLRNEKPSNVFIYGLTGTGKTLVVKHVTNNILDIAAKNKIDIKVTYINCKLKKVADTEYRLIAELARSFGEEVPATGLPTDEIYKLFLSSLEKKNTLLLLVLDEIDQLVNKIGDGILYNLTRLNTELKKSQISVIGISNSTQFVEFLDPRVKSSLSEEELVFPTYDALQLQKILQQRAEVAFKKEVISEGVVEKCAAYAAREHGDARRALDILRVAGEIAERQGHSKVTIKHIDEAEDKIEKDRVLDVIESQPKQFKLALYSILIICSKRKNETIFTGDVYDLYKENCNKVGVRPLTQRRISDIIAELDMQGIISAKVISKGRYGRTREINIAVHPTTIPKIYEILKEGLGLWTKK